MECSPMEEKSIYDNKKMPYHTSPMFANYNCFNNNNNNNNNNLALMDELSDTSESYFRTDASGSVRSTTPDRVEAKITSGGNHRGPYHASDELLLANHLPLITEMSSDEDMIKDFLDVTNLSINNGMSYCIDPINYANFVNSNYSHFWSDTTCNIDQSVIPSLEEHSMPVVNVQVMRSDFRQLEEIIISNDQNGLSNFCCVMYFVSRNNFFFFFKKKKKKDLRK
ncbi:hypothetical protein RFI_03088 [Reticulomyxa filosa]|uniref:Uncharacterized protein n=1 Tax=Reticulomyxa filosa TaxID=46433 RepID=X6P7B4_RETFI|nr:hypothetical protein RFI_03088 [Reticulomyxa filosa]|eukprot:ETO34008.1 hypothetical protein RFI_03088 [Reticulomyxa filosa]